MTSLHPDRRTELLTQMDGVEGLLHYWQAVSDPEQLQEAPGQIAMLETDLASLKIEYEAITNDIKSHP